MTTLFFALILLSPMPSLAMDQLKELAAKRDERLLAMDQLVELDAYWIESIPFKLPSQIEIMRPDEPITDELLLQLNPEWSYLKDALSVENKNKIFLESLHYPDRCARDYAVARTLSSLLVCLGADPNTKICAAYPSRLDDATIKSDYPFAKYLLEKNATQSILKMCTRPTLWYAKSIALAELLIAHGAEIPKTILSVCIEPWAPLSLLRYYLETQKIQLITNENPLLSNTTVITLKEFNNKNQMAKLDLLLKAGLDLTDQDEQGRTALHHAAKVNYHHFCNMLVSHYTRQHERFVLLLGCLKKQFPWFYYRNADMRKLLFKQGFSEAIPKLRKLLCIKNSKKQTAYDIWEIPLLNPATCSYDKYSTLKKESAESK